VHFAARSRCGFATYFADPGTCEDHWICEYWDSAQKRWVKVDPQIDPFQKSLISALVILEIDHIRNRLNERVQASIGLPDGFIEQGTQAILRTKYGIDAKGIARQALSLFPNLASGSLVTVKGKAKTT